MLTVPGDETVLQAGEMLAVEYVMVYGVVYHSCIAIVELGTQGFVHIHGAEAMNRREILVLPLRLSLYGKRVSFRVSKVVAKLT